MNAEKLRNAVLSGAVSASITSVLFQPLEVIKTRLQQPHAHNRSILEVVKYTLKDNKITVLWKGLSPALLRTVPVVSIYFASIETMRSSSLFRKERENYGFILSFASGALARAVADISAFPLSLVKTRYESDIFKYRNIFHAFRSIIQESGFLGLYRGLYATLIRDINYSGFYYMIYSHLKNEAEEASQKDFKSSRIAYYALISSITSCFLTQPPDVVRTYMQLQPKKYTSISKTVAMLYSEKGIQGFFTGFVPRSARRVLISVFSWTLFEKFSIKLN